jgi:hypothetical protein
MATLFQRISFILKDRKNLQKMLLKKKSSRYGDEEYIRKLFKLGCGYEPNLDSPQTFNEKLAWLKLHHRKPVLTKMADKYEVKKLVAEIIGEQYVVPCYGVWNSFDEIDFDKLPNQFVLKATHDSGGVTICLDKSSFDIEGARIKLEKQLQRDFFWAGREWPYKNIPHRIIADQLLDDHSGRELRDYKFWCFNGKPTYMYITNKGKVVEEYFYDMDYNVVDINHGFPRTVPDYQKPEGFDTMKELAKKLSVGMPFVRVDFFQVDGKIYFGEFTFFDWGGDRAFATYKQDLELGQLIDLTSIEKS